MATKFKKKKTRVNNRSTVNFSISIPFEQYEQLDYVANEMNTNRSAVISHILSRAFKGKTFDDYLADGDLSQIITQDLSKMKKKYEDKLESEKARILEGFMKVMVNPEWKGRESEIATSWEEVAKERNVPLTKQDFLDYLENDK